MRHGEQKYNARRRDGDETMRTTTRLTMVAAFAAALALAGCKKDEPTPPDAGGADLKKTDGGKGEGLKVDRPPTKIDGPAAKKPKIAQILPASGFADATTQVTLIGEGFAAGMSAYIDGQPVGTAVNVASAISASFTMPKNPYGPPYDKPQKVSVGVMVGTQLSNSVDFWYTVVGTMDAKWKGSVVTAASSCYRDFPSDPIAGKVLLDTSGSDAGAPPALKAEVGFGKSGSDPTKDGAWKWFPATFKKKDGAYDLFEGTLTVPLAQTYDVAYRFSKDGGGTFIYADTDEGDLKYDPAKAAKLTAQSPPPGFCLTNQDCVVNAYEVTCKVDPADKTKNHCVECLKDSDCTSYHKALGPKCTQELCNCTADGDCAQNENGAKCMKAQPSYCGCTGDTNCVAPRKCAQDPKTGMQTCM
jgi:hypothetical protein